MNLIQYIELFDCFNLNIKSMSLHNQELIVNAIEKNKNLTDFFSEIYESDVNINLLNYKDFVYINLYYLYNENGIPFVYIKDMIELIVKSDNKKIVISFLMAEIKFQFSKEKYELVNYLSEYLFIPNLFTVSELLVKNRPVTLFEVYFRSIIVAIHFNDNYKIYDYYDIIKFGLSKEEKDAIDDYVSKKLSYVFLA